MADFRKPFEKHPRVYAPRGGRSLTKKSFKDEVNINNIVAKYNKTGVCDYVNRFRAAFGDFSNVTDYRDAVHRVRNAEAMFNSIPVNIRKQFDNDAMKFASFASDPMNIDEMVKMGLAERVKPVSDSVKMDEKKSVEK